MCLRKCTFVPIYRCVPDDEKVFALGANFLSSKALGMTETPFFFFYSYFDDSRGTKNNIITRRNQ